MKRPRTLAQQVAWCNYGLPYRWGGDDPLKGFDCSGFVIEVLKSVGVLPAAGDWTADSLYRRFTRLAEAHGINHARSLPEAGVLAFWSYEGIRDKKRHVEICIDADHAIGASGGGSLVQTEADAVQQNAFIKVRPLVPRGAMNGISYVDPFISVESRP